MTLSAPTGTDVLRFAVTLGRARDNEDQVQRVIDDELAQLSPGLHAAYLKVTLRVVVAQLFASAARRLDAELGVPFTDGGLDLQTAENDGHPNQEPAHPRLHPISAAHPARDAQT
ncbi:hypothetical protein GCM10010517_36620 [Streptosporangium fragile]|uniref:Uncharacterized protein n=1 Tax=Streptosporangium fragile TaxID=46186 RepID=A0ABN3VYZ5_9ACTN